MADKKPTSRRDFLRGHGIARTLLDAARNVAGTAGSSFDKKTLAASHGNSAALRHQSSGDVAHLYTSRRAMACEFAIEYHAADGADVASAALEGLDLIEQLENQLSVYREHTEVAEVNRLAAECAVRVEPRLFALLELCDWIHASTHGAFDITSGPLSRIWGFHKREGRLPAQDEIDATLASVGFTHLQLEPTHQTIRFDRPGVEINFNSVGKGYALDRVAQLMSERGVGDYLAHGGRSSVLTRGRDRGGDTAGWSVSIPHPHERERSVGDVVLRDQALGTSGSGTQFFEIEGRRFGHLIDPRTGWPASGVHTATAVAATAAEADALATAFYILGPGGTSEYCASHPEAGALLVCPREGDPSGQLFDVHAFNLHGRWLPAAT
ncbi:MAG: FAD:protein FMN transferase [Planctomycetaceae bacterium]|nr:FAD:protein FMN transferase [Planctomycetaceae bacterium]